MRIGARDTVGIGQLHRLDQFLHASVRTCDAVHLQHLGDLVADPHERIERGHRLLEDHADAAAAQETHFRGLQSEEVPALEVDAAVQDFQGRRQQAHDGAGRDRLAGSAFPHDAEDLAGIERERDILDGVRTVRPRRQGDR